MTAAHQDARFLARPVDQDEAGGIARAYRAGFGGGVLQQAQSLISSRMAEPLRK